MRALPLTRPGCLQRCQPWPQQYSTTPTSKRPQHLEHNDDGCDNDVIATTMQSPPQLRQQKCDHNHDSRKSCRFLGQGDNLHEKKLIWVQNAHVISLYLRCFNVRRIKEKQMREWRENKNKNSVCISALHTHTRAHFQEVGHDVHMPTSIHHSHPTGCVINQRTGPSGHEVWFVQ
jgi:hypothetical protein